MAATALLLAASALPFYGAAVLSCVQLKIAGKYKNDLLFDCSVGLMHVCRLAAPLSGDAAGSALLVAALADGNTNYSHIIILFVFKSNIVCCL
jgi:hypothetical protein